MGLIDRLLEVRLYAFTKPDWLFLRRWPDLFSYPDRELSFSSFVVSAVSGCIVLFSSFIVNLPFRPSILVPFSASSIRSFSAPLNASFGFLTKSRTKEEREKEEANTEKSGESIRGNRSLYGSVYRSLFLCFHYLAACVFQELRCLNKKNGKKRESGRTNKYAFRSFQSVWI